ncbi:hypothetical protein O6H91_10G044700 [Diphasiastrum complanatum]|uniref:Uncharacterized protein n=1 Tax=Diphasiastrum complanatum TaxID=34168 RepID=A0ACC2CGV1_DIPCM|nr:hypothetical protein O6H91_10G044700 [Diphasiastrum complanatum]
MKRRLIHRLRLRHSHSHPHPLRQYSPWIHSLHCCTYACATTFRSARSVRILRFHTYTYATTSRSASSIQPSTSRGTRQMSMPGSFRDGEHREATRTIAQMFYDLNLPFIMASSRIFREAISKVAVCGPGYTPPTADGLRGPLLQERIASVRERLAALQALSRLDLKKPARTRFAFKFIMLERLHKLKGDLRRMVTSAEFTAMDLSTTPEGLAFHEILFMEPFWVDVQQLMDVVLRLVDREGCTMGLIYEFMDRIGESLQRFELDPARLEPIRQLWRRQWDKFHRPIHSVAHILHPLFQSESCVRTGSHTSASSAATLVSAASSRRAEAQL